MQLASLTLVLRDKPAIGALPHVVAAIVAFLDASGYLTLAKACSFNSIRLLDRIWASSCVSPSDRRPGWSHLNWLRSDPVYYKWQFAESATEAARHGHLDVIRWLFAHFEGCKTTESTVEEAVRNNHFEVLQLLLSLSHHRRDQKQQISAALNRGNEVMWGVLDMRDATRNGRGDIVRWLFENTMDWHSLHRIRIAFSEAFIQGDIALVEWLMDRGSYYNPVKAAESEHAHVIRWMFARGQVGVTLAASSMRTMAATGELEIVKWIVREYSSSRSPMWYKCETDALGSACQRNQISVVKWLLEQDAGKIFVMRHPNAMHNAAVHGIS